MKKFIFFILLTAFFTACSKEKLNNEVIEGSWKWEETVPLVSPSLIASSTTRPGAGEIYILSFNSNGAYTYTLNSTMLKSGSYSVRKKSTEDKWVLSYSNQPGLYMINRNSDSLVLVSDIPGAGYSKYIKY